MISEEQDIQKPLRKVKADLDNLLKGSQTGYLDLHSKMTPWFSRWKRWFLDKTRFNDHELIDQPIAFFFMVMADDPDPLRTIENLRKKLPSQYSNLIYNESRSFLQQFVFILNTKPSNPQSY